MLHFEQQYKILNKTNFFSVYKTRQELVRVVSGLTSIDISCWYTITLKRNKRLQQDFRM